jgi:hypothetical protein
MRVVGFDRRVPLVRLARRACDMEPALDIAGLEHLALAKHLEVFPKR